MIKTTCIYDEQGHCIDMFHYYVDDDGPDYNPCDECIDCNCDMCSIAVLVPEGGSDE